MSSSLRVVIADDDRAMRETLQQMLEDLGHDVVAVAVDGESLIDQSLRTQPDVVITGTLTPEMHGSDAAAVIYESLLIPVLLYSGHCEPDLVLKAEQNHVFMYLVKPISQEHMQAALRECRSIESNESLEDDEQNVPVFSASEPFGSMHYREHVRPSYRQLPR